VKSSVRDQLGPTDASRFIPSTSCSTLASLRLLSPPQLTVAAVTQKSLVIGEMRRDPERGFSSISLLLDNLHKLLGIVCPVGFFVLSARRLSAGRGIS